MMRNQIRSLVLAVLVGFSILFNLAETIAQQKNGGLENEKVEVEKAITYTNQLINETQLKKQATLTDLSVLNKKIGRASCRERV
mgnify:CR=1 FL=1